MKKCISGLLISMSLFAFIGNVQGQVTADFDKGVDFSTYKTYSFLGWQKNSDALLNDFDKKRLQDSFKSEFDARNFKYVENGGDMSVSLFIFVDEKTDVTAYTNFTGGMGYGRAGWGMGGASTTVSQNDYRVGTLVMDCYDAKESKLIFQGKNIKTIQEKPAKREKTIPKAVAKLMNKFPVDTAK
jgi:Domain of unknown function (DUF4136)